MPGRWAPGPRVRTQWPLPVRTFMRRRSSPSQPPGSCTSTVTANRAGSPLRLRTRKPARPRPRGPARPGDGNRPDQVRRPVLALAADPAASAGVARPRPARSAPPRCRPAPAAATRRARALTTAPRPGAGRGRRSSRAPQEHHAGVAEQPGHADDHQRLALLVGDERREVAEVRNGVPAAALDLIGQHPVLVGACVGVALGPPARLTRAVEPTGHHPVRHDLGSPDLIW